MLVIVTSAPRHLRVTGVAGARSTGVKVQTFAAWAEAIRKATLPALAFRPPMRPGGRHARQVARGHAGHPRRPEAEIATWCRRSLAAALGNLDGADAVLAAWDGARGPVDTRLTSLARWSREARLSEVLRARLEGCGARLRLRTRDVVGEWAALLTDRRALGDGFAKHAPGLFSDSQLDAIHRWCVERDRLRTGATDVEEGDESYALDAEDEALLLRIHQLQRGSLLGPRGPSPTIT